ncbi:hypothetical protein E2C01_077069 [Portunus trituberculatus]|uniref:Uncharacterized protein n=1 Tax=Portunus trituberculatus TaxID=210409 RepID=A0A5B7IEU6_PORTR|nr:hypothetical protein [Portunus trituberculatus]
MGQLARADEDVVVAGRIRGRGGNAMWCIRLIHACHPRLLAQPRLGRHAPRPPPTPVNGLRPGCQISPYEWNLHLPHSTYSRIAITTPHPLVSPLSYVLLHRAITALLHLALFFLPPRG